MVNSFCGEGDEKNVSRYNADILSSTTVYVSTGLNMTAANNFVLFDPLWMVKDQMQAFARVHRTSQKRLTHLTLLHTKGDLVDRDTINGLASTRQSRRNGLKDVYRSNGEMPEES